MEGEIEEGLNRGLSLNEIERTYEADDILILEMALRRGAIQRVIKYLEFHLDRDPDNIAIVEYAIRYAAKLKGPGNRYILDTLLRRYPEFINDAAYGAASDPDLNGRLYYLVGHGANDFYGILLNAIRGNNLEIIRFALRNIGDEIDPELIDISIMESIRDCNVVSLRLIFEVYQPPAEYLAGYIDKAQEYLSGGYRCGEVLRVLEGLSGGTR